MKKLMAKFKKDIELVKKKAPTTIDDATTPEGIAQVTPLLTFI